jgi:hypothetical protein
MKAGAFMRSTCEKCSRTPATLIKSTKNLGLLWTHKTFRVFTAVLGWWSVVSLFANIAFVADDLAALSAARKMAAPAVSVAAAGEASP